RPQRSVRCVFTLASAFLRVNFKSFGLSGLRKRMGASTIDRFRPVVLASSPLLSRLLKPGMHKKLLFLLTVFSMATLAWGRDEERITRKDLFDPARHMRVSEVREGMKGYGLSVFKNTKIDRFEVEVLSVLKN